MKDEWGILVTIGIVLVIIIFIILTFTNFIQLTNICFLLFDSCKDLPAVLP